MRKLSQLFEEYNMLHEIDKAAGNTVLVTEWKKSLRKEEEDLIRDTLNDFFSRIAPVSDLFKSFNKVGNDVVKGAKSGTL